MPSFEPAAADHTTTADAAPSAPRFKPLRTWIPLLLLPLMAFMRFVPGLIQNGPSMIWMASAFGPFLIGVVVIAWWLLLSRARWFERLLGVAGLVLVVALVQLLADASMRGPPLIVMTIPLTIAGFAIGLIGMGRHLSPSRTAVALALATLGGGVSDLVRTDGVWGDFSLGLAWRWAPTAEDRLRASRHHAGETDATVSRIADPAAFHHPEWPGFRGPDGDGTQRGMAFSGDWRAHPPREVWRIPVGPAWSSFAVAGKYLVTQEQRGDDEAVVCYDADTGTEVWQHTIPSRFFEALGGLGPRATPSIDGGAVYATGAEGWLVKVDGSTGALLWKVDLRKEADREPPMWGFSASPCVHDGLVTVYAGGKGEKGVLAFKAEDGSLAWSAPCGEHSYGSVQLVKLAGRSMLGLLSERGGHLYDPATGAEILAYAWPHQGYRALQPRVVGRDAILIPTGMGTGTRLVRISETDGGLTGEEVWTTKDLKSDFNDCVLHEGFAYGFDNTIFTCIDLATGKRRWKGGRYEKGQALLLADSGLIVVVSERGELILLRANPDRLEELATIPALSGKSWNHPVVVGDRLYLRNAEEAVCYQLHPEPHEAATESPPGFTWHDVAAWDIEGRLWDDEPRRRTFDRLPAAAESAVPAPVWNLGRNSAGMLARFRTDARTIRVRMKLLEPQLAMPHMPATGVSGVDLYGRDATGRWRWIAATKPEKREFEAELVSGLEAGPREFAAYLPLYNGVEALAIGVPEDAACEPLPCREKPVVFYGTSITQGGCASRPGMAHVAILGRRLDHPVANLGFSGHGRMDATVGDLLGRIDAACFVIDCLPNMTAAQVRERCIPLVENLRTARPGVPIVLVEDRRVTNAWIRPAVDRLHDDRHAAIREAFDSLVARGATDLHLIAGDDLLGDDSEGTVDASHPTDLGFVRQADAFEPVLRRILEARDPAAP